MATPNADPRLEYTSRLEARRNAVERFDRYDRWLGRARLSIALLFAAALALSIWRGLFSPWWSLVPLGLFIIFAAIHEGVLQSKERAMKAVAFYEDGLARIDDRWIGRGSPTELLRDDSHLYAPDLDLFGKGSLFELLCTARTRSGEETLARWLCEPAAPAEILSRQKAIDELRRRLDLREDLAILGAGIRSSLHPDELSGWGTAPLHLKSAWPRVAAPLLAALVFGALAATGLDGSANTWRAFYGSLLAEAIFALIYRSRVRRVMEAAEGPRRELELLAHILARMEREPFVSETLAGLRASLDTSGLSPSRRIAQFSRRFGAAHFKQLDGPIALYVYFQFKAVLVPFTFLLWNTQIAFNLESWRRRYGPAIAGWLAAVGEFEALCALAGYAYEHPADPFPEIVEEGPLFVGDDLRHPLIPAAQCVPNSVRLDVETRFLVVSGSNMSGKSTLLRTAGVNTILSLAGAPVRARRLRLSPLAVGATIRIQDSLQAGTSRFYTEIQRIRRIMDLANGERPVLFLLDELLHGTNSRDRALGAEGIIKGLLGRGAIGLATTHDLALAKIADALAPHAANVHFQDELKDGRMIFDYRMHPGVVQKSNALQLMRAVGLEVEE